MCIVNSGNIPRIAISDRGFEEKGKRKKNTN